jgi:hypothetical protein
VPSLLCRRSLLAPPSSRRQDPPILPTSLRGPESQPAYYGLAVLGSLTLPLCHGRRNGISIVKAAAVSRSWLLLVRTVKAATVALDQCGGATMFLQAAMVVVHRCSSFFNDPSAVPMVAAMASAARA